MKKNKLLIMSVVLLFGYIFYNVIYDLIRYDNLITSDPLLQFYHYISSTDLFYLQLIGPLFVIIPSVYYFHKSIHSGFICSCMTRISYKEYMKKHYLNALKHAFILPLAVVVLFLTCVVILQSWDVGSEANLYGYFSSPDPVYLSHLGLFMINYMVCLFLHSIFYVNLGLVYTKKCSSFLVNVILSYLTFVAMEIISSAFIGGLFLARLLDIHYWSDTLSLFNVWIYSGVQGLLPYFLFSLFLALTSTLIVLRIYRSKEGVIIESEK